jgi:hypothetical protein
VKLLISLALSGSVLAGVAAAAPVIAAPSWQAGNSTATGDQDTVAIATNRNGHVAIVWEDDRDTTAPEDNVHSDVWVRLFKDGTPVYEAKLSAGGTGNWRHLAPDVGLDDKGNAVVVWADDPDANGFYNIPVRVLSPTGAVLYSAQANTDAAGQQLNPTVSVDPDGVPTAPSTVAYAVAWEDTQGTAAPTVRIAAFKNATRTYEKQVHTSGGTHKRPDVAVTASGEAIVVWDEDGDGNGVYNVGLTRFSAAGTVTLAKTIANSNAAGQEKAAQVAVNFNGDFAVAWEADAAVAFRGFSHTGTALHADVSVATAGIGPSVGIDDQQNVVVAWTVSGVDTFVRGYGPNGDGTGRLESQQLSQVTAGKQDGIVTAVSPWGEVSVAYTDDNDGNASDQIILGVGVASAAW